MTNQENQIAYLQYKLNIAKEALKEIRDLQDGPDGDWYTHKIATDALKDLHIEENENDRKL